METHSEEPHALEIALADQIKVELLERKMYQHDLADKIGVSRGALSRYLNGHRTFSYTQLLDIAGALGMSASELVARAEARLS